MREKRPMITEQKKARIEKVLHRVLEDVKPTPNEIKLLTAKSNELMGRLKAEAPKNVDILLVGSVARGTQVRGSSDIDIFLLFPKTQDERKMEAEGLKIAKAIIKKGGEKFEIKYAEHPYTRIFLKDINATADIVPAFKISKAEEMGSAVDRTQLHNKFVNSKLSQKQRNDVRILKIFLNARDVYGAEARIEGFSGYLCELLVYYYGSFINVLENFLTLRLPIAIDVINKGAEKHNVAELAKRFNSEFIVIDPTDHNRNVAANVSKESLAKTVLGARTFIKEPGIDTFYTKRHSGLEAKAAVKNMTGLLGIDVFLIAFKLPDMTEDILWQQLKKLRVRVYQELRHHSHTPIGSLQSISGADGIMAFFIPNAVKKSFVVTGPSAFAGNATEAFVEAHAKSYGIFFDHDRLISIEKKKFQTAGDLLKHLVSQREIKFPSYISRKGVNLYTNKIPEKYAKMLHEALEEKMVHQ
jgi:tRNA nucleotidyltransferase (CCA-adding enzyme)